MDGIANASTQQPQMLWRGEPGYEQARRAAVWNARKPARHPEVIVLATSDQDVAEAVRFARDRGLRIAVRAGGHSWCGSPIRDGGMLIDLSAMRELSIDPTSQTAAVSPAVSARQLASALAAHGLAFPVGHCGSVPMSGYLLAGGAGWNMGAWGPACFSLERVEVVTAAGERIVADAKHNTDYFWAAQGAGPGFFGVATRFHVRVYPMPQIIRTSTYLYPLADVEDIGRWMAEIAPTLPTMLETLVMLTTAPPGAAAGPAGKAVAIAAAVFADTEVEATQALAVLDSSPCLTHARLRQTNQPSSFASLHDSLTQLLPEAHRYAADTLWSNNDLNTLLPPLAEQIVTAPSAKSLIIAAPAAPRPAAAVLPDAAFSMVGRVLMLCYAIWADETEDDANDTWLRDTVQRLEPHTIGHYVAEADLTASPLRSTRSFAPTNWERLQLLKKRHDPNNLFHSYLGLD